MAVRPTLPMGAIRPTWLGGQTSPPQISRRFGFRGRGASGFSFGGCDIGG
jgi:hypothetical protein